MEFSIHFCLKRLYTLHQAQNYLRYFMIFAHIILCWKNKILHWRMFRFKQTHFLFWNQVITSPLSFFSAELQVARGLGGSSFRCRSGHFLCQVASSSLVLEWCDASRVMSLAEEPGSGAALHAVDFMGEQALEKKTIYWRRRV